MLGGAAHLDKNKEKYKRLFTNVVNGEAKNVFSTGDTVLLLYMVSEAAWHPLGRNRVRICRAEAEDQQEESRQKKHVRYAHDLVQSFDITSSIVTRSIGGGQVSHSDYSNSRIQAEIFERIQFKT